MPNWCENRLEITGPERELTLFLAKAKEKDKPLSFQKLHPMPTELAGTSSPGETPNWYDWRVEHWGTKWDTGREVHADEGSATSQSFSFDTAWSPPTALVKKVSGDFPGLLFRLEYAECGMCFAGFEEYSDGEMITGSHGKLENYEWSKKLIWEECEKCGEDYQPHEDEHECEEKNDGN
jgi:hypothetical protein